MNLFMYTLKYSFFYFFVDSLNIYIKSIVLFQFPALLLLLNIN